MIDRRSILAGLAAAPIVGCATAPSGGDRRLKLVCFNIWHNQGDWAARPAAAVARPRRPEWARW